MSRTARKPAAPEKRYDKAYFDRWYRNPWYRVIVDSRLERKVRLAVAATEFVTGRKVRRVLDVGCGEGAWQPVLKKLRPGVRYTGVDSSEYAIGRFGTRRHLRLGRVADLGRMGLEGPYDLIVCADVLHYLPAGEVQRGLHAIGRLLGGVAFIEVYAREDESEGDEDGYQARSAAEYARMIRAAGLTHVGLHCFVGREYKDLVTSFERGGLTP